MILFENEYFSEFRMWQVDHFGTCYDADFKQWVSMVLLEGLAFPSLDISEIDVKLGVSLHHVYQHINRFGDSISGDLLDEVFLGITESANIGFREMDVYPNIYGYGLFLERVYGDTDFVVISVSKTCVEGMVFSSKNCFLNQNYMICPAHLDRMNSGVGNKRSSEAETLGPECHTVLDSFLEAQLREKLGHLFNGEHGSKVFLVHDGALAVDEINKIRTMIGECREMRVLMEGEWLACYGLLEAFISGYTGRSGNRFTVSVNGSMTTFLGTKNDGYVSTTHY